MLVWAGCNRHEKISAHFFPATEGLLVWSVPWVRALVLKNESTGQAVKNVPRSLKSASDIASLLQKVWSRSKQEMRCRGRTVFQAGFGG